MTTPLPFSGSSTRFSLPFLFAGQSQKEFFFNESVARIDIMVQATVLGETEQEPQNPADGDAWLIGENPIGDWSEKAGHIAGRQAGVWHYFEPQEGMQIYDKTARQIVSFRNGWIRIFAPDIPSSGAVQDTELRTAFAQLLESLAETGIFPVT